VLGVAPLIFCGRLESCPSALDMCSVADCVVISGGSALIWRIWVLMMA